MDLMSHGLRRNGKIMAKISPPPSHCREGKYTRGGFKILKWSLRCGPARPILRKEDRKVQQEALLP
jgi:hypothetical protein